MTHPTLPKKVKYLTHTLTAPCSNPARFIDSYEAV
jgi:hypothetical protein